MAPSTVKRHKATSKNITNHAKEMKKTSNEPLQLDIPIEKQKKKSTTKKTRLKCSTLLGTPKRKRPKQDTPGIPAAGPTQAHHLRRRRCLAVLPSTWVFYGILRFFYGFFKGVLSFLLFLVKFEIFLELSSDLLVF